MRIGVDVGGTNTDAVLMDDRLVKASYKAPTSANISDGIVSAISHVMEGTGVLAGEIDSVMIGTTQFTNAFVERRSLLPVGVIRLALPATRGLPPMIDWPSDIANVIGNNLHLVGGGYEFDGREISPLDEQAVAHAARDLKQKGIRTIAISGVFSPVKADMEERAAEIVHEEMPEASVTLSSRIGRLSLMVTFNVYGVSATPAVIVNEHLETVVVETGDPKRAEDIVRAAAIQMGLIHFGLGAPEEYTVPLNPETAENYEIGVRSSWLDNRLIANITAYMVDYTDPQVSQLVGTEFLQTNAGKADAEGVDVELNVAITEGLTAWLNYNYFNGEFTSPVLFPGNEMVAPPHAFTTGMAYSHQLADNGELRFRFDLQHKDEYFQDPANEPGIRNGLDSIVNASVTWDLGSNWAVTLWGKNLTDERAFNYLNDTSVFMLSGAQLGAGQSTLAANYIPPLTWGVSVRYTFE